MKTRLTLLATLLIGLGFCTPDLRAQTDGSAKLQVTLLDYNGSSARHYTVVWVTSPTGAFIKSLRKQGPSSWTDSEWRDHCGTWNTARAGSTALDGYSSATAQNYSGTNSPVVLTWNCRDRDNNLMPDGNYKFWVQYAENSGQGPVTTSGLLWTKGAAGGTTPYPNQGANFASMSVTWTPSAPPTEPPVITSAAPTATGTVGVPYQFTSSATGTAPIGFTASGLPTGLSMSTAGLISGIPAVAGVFNGSITATNGTPPNANQPFTITIDEVPATITAMKTAGSSLILSGDGPPNGVYSLLVATNLVQSTGVWNQVSTGDIDASGKFSVTNTPDAGVSQQFYRLRVP